MTVPQNLKISEEVLQELSSTEYACSSLEQLSGGTANFVFKGTLSKPLPDGTTEVAIKHGESFLAATPDFQLPTARCKAEQECLRSLSALPGTDGTFSVRTPKLYHFNPTTNTQVQEYLPSALSLKEYALKHFSASRNPFRTIACHELGRCLGVWLREFHALVKLPEQEALRETARANAPMQQLKHYVNYAVMVETVDNYPEILGEAKGTLEEIRDETAKELERADLQVVHGDFWTGNALIPSTPLTLTTQTPLFIVDWEVCHFGLPALDLGQMIAELYQLSLFKGIDEGKWLIEGFTAGYGFVDDEFAFRVALHVGTHLLAWGTRVPGWGSEKKLREVVGVARDIVLKAWGKERSWFEVGELACLFER